MKNASTVGLCAMGLAAIALLASGATAWAIPPNPADAAKGHDQEAAPEAPPRPDDTTRSWERKPQKRPYTVSENLTEENRVGPYGQPRWTTHRRFGETRVYVAPEGQFEFEYWLVPEFPREGSAEVKTQYEVEMGLPHRFQIDLYIVNHQEGNQGPSVFDEQKFEVRWALADWGRIWANPTLYLEWAAIDQAPDHVEGKVLLGDELAPRWHWGANFVFEHETGGEHENAYELTSGVSYTVTDTKLSVGVEEKFAWINTDETRTDNHDSEKEFLVGPSLQYRPLPRMHIDFAPLVGLTPDSPHAKATLILGWEF